MKQLIRIETIPISIEMRTHNARFERKGEMAQVEVSRNRGGLSIKSRPIKLNIDTFEARNSICPTTATNIYQNAQEGKSAAYEATARIANEGQMMLDIHLNQDALGQIAESRMEISNDTQMTFLPSVGPNISWEPAEFSIRYEMDRLNFDWKIGHEEFEFIPGDIEFSIKEYNRVIIEYIGGPIYVPPSSDPEYVPIDIKA